MDLVRHILLRVEAADGPLSPLDMASDIWDEAMVEHHLDLMAHHGLVDVFRAVDMGGAVVCCEAKGLTWDGCDYLDAVRDGKVWDRTKAAVKKAVGSTTMAVVKEAAVMVATQAIRAQVGA